MKVKTQLINVARDICKYLILTKAIKVIFVSAKTKTDRESLAFPIPTCVELDKTR